MLTSDVISTASSLVTIAFEIAGPRAPAVLARYAALTYLNRTSRGRPIRKGPTRLSRSSAPRSSQWDADVVVPVYNDFEGVSGVLDVLRQEAAQFERIRLVHDCSTDVRVAPLLRAFGTEVPNAALIENERNLGFLQSCNRGLKESKNDIIILNTDIELPLGALGRLMETLCSDPDVASVTPFSSNAYAAGFPDLNYDNKRPFGATTAQIDAAFQAIGPFEPIDIPRGVGFCMAMSRNAIEKVGVFDPAFGAGYGEEADFCLRARQMGFRNLLAPNVYVYHRAGQSFGSSAQRRAREALIRLLVRHSDYPQLVRDYLEAGEARAVSFAALMRLAEDIGGSGGSQGDPRLQTKGADGRRATVMLNGETHHFTFASPDIADMVFALAGTRG